MLLQGFRARLVPTQTKPPSHRVRRGADGPATLVGQWIGADLDMNGARARALAALHQPGRTVAARAPKAATLPAGVRVVDASIESFGIEAQGIWNAQKDHLAVLQRHETVVEVGGGNRNVLAKTNRVVLIDPGLVARLDASVLEAFKARSGIFVEFPAFRTVVAGCSRTVKRSLAQAPVEADKMSAGLRPPRDSGAVDVAAANSNAGFWNGVEF